MKNLALHYATDRVRNYARALDAGCVFPTVKVGFFRGKKIIVDGVHRVRAREFNKIDYVEYWSM